MYQNRPKPDLKCITDKNYLQNPGLFRNPSISKPRYQKSNNDANRCDSPDLGGGSTYVKHHRVTRSSGISEMIKYTK